MSEHITIIDWLGYKYKKDQFSPPEGEIRKESSNGSFIENRLLGSKNIKDKITFSCYSVETKNEFIDLIKKIFSPQHHNGFPLILHIESHGDEEKRCFGAFGYRPKLDTDYLNKRLENYYTDNENTSMYYDDFLSLLNHFSPEIKDRTIVLMASCISIGLLERSNHIKIRPFKDLIYSDTVLTAGMNADFSVKFYEEYLIHADLSEAVKKGNKSISYVPEAPPFERRLHNEYFFLAP